MQLYRLHAACWKVQVCGKCVCSVQCALSSSPSLLPSFFRPPQLCCFPFLLPFLPSLLPSHSFVLFSPTRYFSFPSSFFSHVPSSVPSHHSHTHTLSLFILLISSSCHTVCGWHTALLLPTPPLTVVLHSLSLSFSLCTILSLSLSLSLTLSLSLSHIPLSRKNALHRL